MIATMTAKVNRMRCFHVVDPRFVECSPSLLQHEQQAADIQLAQAEHAHDATHDATHELKQPRTRLIVD